MGFRVCREREDGWEEFGEEACDEGVEAAEVVVRDGSGLDDRSGDEEAIVEVRSLYAMSASTLACL